MRTRLLPTIQSVTVLAATQLGLWAAALPDEPFTNTVSGTWTWAFTMPDGSVVRPKLKLSQDGETFKGISSVGAGTETPIDNGRLQGDQLSFEVVRERDGQQTITRYRGKLGAGVVLGKIESNWTGEFQSYDW